ncbi:MAG: OmpA family protein [Polyangiaceae bacterium]
MSTVRTSSWGSGGARARTDATPGVTPLRCGRKWVRARARDRFIDPPPATRSTLRLAVLLLFAALTNCASAPPGRVPVDAKPVHDPPSGQSSASQREPEVQILLADPNLDTDGDGIPDVRDRCPRVVGTGDGCRTVIEPPGSSHVAILEKVPFAADAAGIATDEYPILDEVVMILRDHPELARVRVIGFADDAEGSPLRLSELRADAVVNYLVAKGVDKKRLSAIGKGTAQPVLTDDTPTARGRNRRVEFEIVKDGSS